MFVGRSIVTQLLVVRIAFLRGTRLSDLDACIADKRGGIPLSIADRANRSAWRFWICLEHVLRSFLS
jgi:hypothetical protein